MSFQFLPFTKLKNNFLELKESLTVEENAEKIKVVEKIIDELLSSNANEIEKSKILTGAMINANFVIIEPTPATPIAPVWRIVDLDQDTKPKQVSIPITNVNSAIGVNKDNALDEESKRQALSACLQHMSKSLAELKKENEQRRNTFANKYKMFGDNSTVTENKSNTMQVNNRPSRGK